MAQEAAGAGLVPIPTRPASKTPALPAWKAYQKRRPSDAELASWFGSDNVGLAIVCGEISGSLLVVDFDDRTAFEYVFSGWREMAAQLRIVQTSRGVHLYCRLKGGGKPRKTSFRKKPSAGPSTPQIPVDIQGEGSYVVAPPSTHPSGKPYEFLGEGREIQEVTEEELHALLQRSAEKWPFVELVLPAWKEGNRNNLVLGLAKILAFDRGFDENRVLDVVRRICCAAGDREVESRVRSARDTIAKGPERTAALQYLGQELYGQLLAAVPRKATRGQSRRGNPDEDGIRFCSFAELEDGRLADEVETPEGPAFLLYDPRTGATEIVQEVAFGGEHVRPLPLPIDPKQPKRRIVVLADGVQEYGSARELLSEMESLAGQVYDAGGDSAVLGVWIAAALLSWIIGPLFEGMPERFASILAAIGPSESGKGRALKVAQAFFFRPFLFLKTTRTPSLFRALDGWGDGATLILNEADVKDSVESAEFIEYLNSRADGNPITRYSSDRGASEYFSSFGSTVLALRRPYSDDGFSSRTVPLHTETTSRDIDLVAPQEWWDATAAVRRKLELFRLRQVAAIRAGRLRLGTRVSLPKVHSHRVKEIFLGLQALEDSGESGILDAVRPQAEELERRLILARSSSPDGLVLNSIYSELDNPEWSVEKYGTDWILQRTHVRTRRGPVGRDEDGETELQPLYLRHVAGSLGDAFSPTDIAKAWRSFGQKVESQARVGGRRWRGVLLVSDPRRLDREFRRYVPEARPQLERFPAATQTVLDPPADTQLSGTSGTSGTKNGGDLGEAVPLVPHVPANRTPAAPSGTTAGDGP